MAMAVDLTINDAWNSNQYDYSLHGKVGGLSLSVVISMLEFLHH